jgi:hypothetical protein
MKLSVGKSKEISVKNLIGKPILPFVGGLFTIDGYGKRLFMLTFGHSKFQLIDTVSGISRSKMVEIINRGNRTVDNTGLSEMILDKKAAKALFGDYFHESQLVKKNSYWD